MNNFFSRSKIFLGVSMLLIGCAIIMFAENEKLISSSLPSAISFGVVGILCFIFAYLSDMDGRKKNEKQNQANESALSAAKKRIVELELQAAGEINSILSCDGKGMPSVVCRLRREGKSENYIAEYLSDKGMWCSNPQIGALLHMNTKPSGITAEGMTKHAQRLLDKA